MNVQTGQEQYPQNTWQLLKYIARKIPSRLMKALPMTIAIGAGGWLLHTFLLVYVNQGFSPDTWLGTNFLNVSGRLLSSTLLWTLAGALIPMLISFFKKGGNPIKSVTGIVKMPGEILQKNKVSGGQFLPTILFCCAGTLLVENLLSGVAGALAGGMLMGSVVAFLTGRGSIFIQLARMMINDVQVFILKKSQKQLDANGIMIIFGTAGTVLLLAGVLRTIPIPGFVPDFMQVFWSIILSYAWIGFLIAAIILLVTKGKAPRQLLFILGIIGLSAVVAKGLQLTALADDGGWQEAGGTLWGWLTSAGAIPATLSGLPPAIGGLIGAYVSSILGGLFQGFDPFEPAAVPQTPVASQEPVILQPPTPAGQTPAQPQTPEPKPISPEEQERIRQEEERQRLEQERLREEFERRRQEEMERQAEARRKAQEELDRIRKEKEAHQQYIKQLCAKYNTTPDKLRSVIREKMGENAKEAQSWLDYEKKLAYAETAAQLTVIAADTALDGLANATGPIGRGIRAGYKVTKGITSSMAEDGISKDALISGAIKGGADAATDLTENPWAKAGITIAGETAAGAVSEGWAGAGKGLKEGIYNAGANAITDKLAGPGFGNDMKMNFNKNGTADVAINSGGKWVQKTLTGESAIKFANKKIGNQITQSAIKGVSGTINEMVVKPAIGPE